MLNSFLDPGLHAQLDCEPRLMLDTALVSPLRSPVDVTLVVTYSVSRLYMLDGLCLSWGGPISAAVYQVLTLT